MSDTVGAVHRFHDPAYAREWAGRFRPTPERLHLFETMLAELRRSVPDSGHLVELGIGPAYLAEFLLARLPDVTYEGIDFSLPMLAQAESRLERFGARVHLRQADLLSANWGRSLSRQPAAILSTWALHDLGGQEQTSRVYRVSAQALPKGGLLLNGDFIKPEGARQPFEAGRFKVKRHLQLLREAGFSKTGCLHTWEVEIVSPTPAQNYACLLAIL